MLGLGLWARLLRQEKRIGVGLFLRPGLVVRGRCGSPRARLLIRDSAVMARAAKDAKLNRRTLTKLYNERPTWRKPAQRELDAAVPAAYAATDRAGERREDWAEDWFDAGAGEPLPEAHLLTVPRAETDQTVLANLLRLNLARAEPAH